MTSRLEDLPQDVCNKILDFIGWDHDCVSFQLACKHHYNLIFHRTFKDGTPTLRQGQRQRTTLAYEKTNTYNLFHVHQLQPFRFLVDTRTLGGQLQVEIQLGNHVWTECDNRKQQDDDYLESDDLDSSTTLTTPVGPTYPRIRVFRKDKTLTPRTIFHYDHILGRQCSFMGTYGDDPTDPRAADRAEEMAQVLHLCLNSLSTVDPPSNRINQFFRVYPPAGYLLRLLPKPSRHCFPNSIDWKQGDRPLSSSSIVERDYQAAVTWGEWWQTLQDANWYEPVQAFDWEELSWYTSTTTAAERRSGREEEHGSSRKRPKLL
ncbi:expressed unknown protein [Seminavis robusta]|uniref:Uncharacterized protein n=1 Tax=Seminavis robusta TaxID=568900 RepID=A0A9N8DVT6_9STRA|nr:expressed unknown protein [Seminavis robusta]|eukprot:Sro313_g114760.1 n/a (318) ;mRNA; f:21124-22077